LQQRVDHHTRLNSALHNQNTQRQPEINLLQQQLRSFERKRKNLLDRINDQQTQLSALCKELENQKSED
jgi:hypothetical protein